MEFKKLDMSWKEAITQVLRQAGEAMQYTDIADEIIKQKLRTNKVGATPARTVNYTISQDINKLNDASAFVRVASGEYALRESITGAGAITTSMPTGDLDSFPTLPSPAGIIQAFGMFWRRDLVMWKASPSLFGIQQLGAERVDLANQKGVYLLHDRRDVVYAGRATEQPLGARLWQHTYDRLNGRWDRFSWFGLLGVEDDGRINDGFDVRPFGLSELVCSFEALLIEALEPPQNRKRGDDLRAVEYFQAEDPRLQQLDKRRLIEQIATLLDR